MAEEQRSYWGVIPGEVMHDKELPHAGKLLYLVLSSMAHKNGYCWPSNETLAAELNLSKRRVRELLAMLQERGYIRVHVRRTEETSEVERRFIYCGMFPDRETAPPSGEDLPDPPAEDCLPSGEKSPDPPAKSRTAIKCKKNKEENIPPIVPREILRLCEGYAGEDAQLLDAILGLLENRAAANKSPVKTTRAMNGILNKLDKLSGGDRGMKLALLEKATVSNWLTVFPLKLDELPTSSSVPYNEEGEDGI